MKTARWAKGIVEWEHDGTIHISVVFTWDADQAYSRALFYKQMGYPVRVGGPGVFVNKKAFDGVAEVGGSFPDAVSRHNPDATFASRGCPVGCWFCIVPAMEGKDFTLIDNFEPRPILCDNNLSALPLDFQKHIIKRYADTNTPLMDANSGFEPKTFNDEIFNLWRQVNRGPWRFAYDETGEREDVKRVMDMLKGVPKGRKRVYVLIGNEPFSACMTRIREVIDWGGEPHVQPLMKLNARIKRPWVRYDWTERSLLDVARWANRHLYKYTSFEQYAPNFRSKAATSNQLKMALCP